MIPVDYVLVCPVVEVTILSLDRVVDALGHDPEPYCLLEGSDVTFTCNVEGFPRPSITFIKNSQVLVSGEGRVIQTSFDQITISAIQMSDEGLYTCIAVRNEIVTLLNPVPAGRIFCSKFLINLHPILKLVMSSSQYYCPPPPPNI